MKARNRGAHADRVRQEPRGRTGRKRRRRLMRTQEVDRMRLMRTQEVDRMRPPIRQVW